MTSENHELVRTEKLGDGKLGVKCTCGGIHPYDQRGVNEMDPDRVWDSATQQFKNANQKAEKEEVRKEDKNAFVASNWGMAKM
ncbi:MAG: hypothetical protein WDN09_00610 [bacterium]